MWRNVWFIAKQDWKHSKWGLLFSVLLYVYFCFFSTFLVNELLGDAGKKEPFASFLTDITFLTSMSCTAFLLTGEYRSYWKTDIFSRKMFFMRIMPIAIRELVCARYMQMGAHVLLLSAVFFIPFYVFSTLKETYSFAQYVSFATLWICLGACSGAVYACKEMTSSGRSYFWFSKLHAAAYIALAGLGWFAGFGFFTGSLWLVERFGASAPLAALAITALWLLWWSGVTEKKIRSRDYSR